MFIKILSENYLLIKMSLLFIKFRGEVTDGGYRIILIIDGVNDIEFSIVYYY